MFPSRPSVVVLSRGSTWSPNPWDPPYTLPNDVAGGAWPGGATAQAVFYDNAGGQLATVTGTVTASGIAFTATPTVMDLVPNGANFEVFVTVSGAPYQIRYGKVIRREAQFTQVPASVTTPADFIDSWPTLGIRSTWIIVKGSPVVIDNSGVSLPNGATAQDGAMRWYKPLSTDTVSAKVSTVNRFVYGASTFALMRVIICANTALNSYLAVEFESSANGGGAHTDTIRFCVGTSPDTVSYQGSTVTNVTASGDSYRVHYDDSTGILSVYKNTGTSPLGSWTDATHIVPHGPGYRYTGLAWVATVNALGIQATTWQAIDDA